MSPLRVELSSSIGEIGAGAWSRLEGGRSLFLSRPWLAWAERDAAFRPTFAVVRDGHDRLLGGLPTYRWHGGDASVDSWYDPVKVFVAPHVAMPPARDRWFPVLLLGSRAGYHGDVLVDPGLDGARRDAVVRALVGAAERLAGDAGARSTAFMYVPKAAADTVLGMAGRAGHAVPTSAEAVIGTDHTSFDDYLAQLPKRRRDNVKREIRIFEAAGVAVRETTLGEACDQIGPLLGRLQRKYGSEDADERMTERLRAQATALDGISRVFLETRDGQVVGFSLCYEWAGVLYVRASGFDREAGSARFAYFNLGLYRPLRHAIEHGLRAVNLGVSAYQGKVARGAALEPLWSVVWPPTDADPASLAALAQPAPEAAEAEAVVPGSLGRHRPAAAAGGDALGG